MTSPTDSALEMKKRKRFNQMAAAHDQQKIQTEKPTGSVIGISDCDLGASPQMSKNSVLSSYKNKPPGKMSPLGVTTRQFQLNQQ